MASFTDQKPHTVTEAHLKARWGGGLPGERFRCYLCGYKFKLGDTFRFIICTHQGCTNFLVCTNCDPDDDDLLIKRWIARNEEFDSDKFWALR